MKNSSIRVISMAAIMGAVAFVLQYFSFSIPVLSPFASFDFSALPEIVGGFILGPLGAILIIVVKLGLILVFKGTSSMFTGEVQNFILSCAYVLPAILYYRKNRTKKGAIIGLTLGSLLSVFIAIFTNLYLIFPAYIYLYGMSWESILGICNAVNPLISTKLTFVAFSVIPFNLISRAVSSVITFFLYKRISNPIKKFIQ
ncbi:MAG: ECF transporter S component [Firmicutes bacterium]|nr:ECF transporter S component [Bacillota bacterium]